MSCTYTPRVSLRPTPRRTRAAPGQQPGPRPKHGDRTPHTVRCTWDTTFRPPRSAAVRPPRPDARILRSTERRVKAFRRESAGSPSAGQASFPSTGPADVPGTRRLRLCGVKLLRRYWTWLGSRLHLTRGGQVVFTTVAALGLIGVIGDDTPGGVEGPNVTAILGLYVILVLLAVLATDAAVRFARSHVRRAQ